MSFNNSSSKVFSSNTLANPTTPFYGGGGGNASDWANYPAITDVNMNGFDINNLDKINLAQEVSANLLVGVTTTTRTVSSGTQPFTLQINGDSGTNTHVLTADGTGNCSWVAPSGSTPGGVVNSLQYNNPVGTFAGSPNLIVTDEGGSIGSKISNSVGTNSLCLDRGAVNQNSVILESTNTSTTIEANGASNARLNLKGETQLSVYAGASTTGTAGQVLTAVGDTTCLWQNPAGGGGITTINSQSGPAITFTSGGGTISINSPTANTINFEALGTAGVTSLNGNNGVVTIVGTGAPNDVTVSGALVNPILITAPGIATAIADAATAQAAANAAQTTADTALADATAAQATATAAAAAAATADATAVAAAAGAATANAGVATILSSYVTQITAGSNITISPTGGTGNVTINSTGGGGVGFVDALQIYVAPNGNNITGNGSQQNPYLTIAQAITKRATLSNASEVSIILSSGTYTESFTLLRNTYLIGVQTGESRQPCNITGTITMNDITGSMGLSGLEINGNVTTSGTGGSYTIFGCNISGGAGVAINATTGTVFITECRLSSSGGIVISSSSTMTIRDCVILQSGVNPCFQSSTSFTIRQSLIQSTSTSTSPLPLVKLTNSTAVTSEISYCKLEYTSNATDTAGNKCCIQYNGTGTATTSIFDNLFICEGAITGSPQIQCIQDVAAGAVNISFGNLKAGPTATHISPNATKTPYNTVV